MVVLVGLLDHTIYRWLLGILLFLLFMQLKGIHELIIV